MIEPKHTKGISSSQLVKEITDKGVTSDNRLTSLKKLLNIKPLIKLIESHSGITGLIIEKTKINIKDEEESLIDLLSSLTVSTSMGKPDTEVVDFSTRFQMIEKMEVTTKPVIVDGDTGGKIEHFRFKVRTLERLGVSAVL